ncbi:MAG: hypothetical protein KBD51_00280 [Candidatus Levybacteria bacterium]|nr:hypothetical protein [Candidatus Levybacteria bacterium]
MASPDIFLPTPFTPEDRKSNNRQYSNPLQIVETPDISGDSPHLVTEAVRGAIDLGRRVFNVKRNIREGLTIVHTLSPQTPYSEGDIPGKDRPYRIYESLTPEDAVRLSGR